MRGQIPKVTQAAACKLRLTDLSARASLRIKQNTVIVAPLAMTTTAVIARLDRAIQYSAAAMRHRDVTVYWMPAFAGMTARGRLAFVPAARALTNFVRTSPDPLVALRRALQVQRHLIPDARGSRSRAQPMEAIMRKIHDLDNLPSFQRHA
uniref:hypothetical protein n=1 Tax=Bradyrhizobium sp. (strain ORS 278) TaxID=114615 RepID=UPI001389C0D7|nr:hypothetical protein [Bradyrhizobium sp. ORS 278]